MKILLLLISTLLVFKESFSQFFIGQTELEVRSEVPKIYPVEKRVEQGGVFTLIWHNDSTQTLVGVRFKDRYSFETVYVITDKFFLNSYISFFNDNYVKLNSKQWDAYIRDNVYEIRLSYRVEDKNTQEGYIITTRKKEY